MSAPSDDARARVKRLVAEAPAQLADGMARVIRDASGDPLDRLMRTPARRVVLESIFWQLPRHLDRERAAGVSSAVRWRITGRPDGGTDTYHLEIVDGDCRVTRGEAGIDPRLTITLDGAEFVRLVTGKSDALRAYFSGRLTLTGDMMFAGKLVSLFRAPRSGRSATQGPQRQK
jgi:hypothetical protein